jgi:hypothetical protein
MVKLDAFSPSVASSQLATQIAVNMTGLDTRMASSVHERGPANRVRHNIPIFGQRLMVCDQNMREKAWRSRKRGA